MNKNIVKSRDQLKMLKNNYVQYILLKQMELLGIMDLKI